MICILSAAANPEPVTSGSRALELGARIDGWIIATDIDDARRQAQMAGDHELAGYLYRVTADPPAGRVLLPTGHLMLVA